MLMLATLTDEHPSTTDRGFCIDRHNCCLLFVICSGGESRREWTVHIQSGAGLVADSVPESEYEETVNKVRINIFEPEPVEM